MWWAYAPSRGEGAFLLGGLAGGRAVAVVVVVVVA